MVGPIDYTMNVLDPIQGAMRGYALGRQDIEQSQIMREREQAMGIRGQQEQRAAQEFEERRAEAARKRAQAEEMRSQLMGLREMAVGGTLTPEALDQFAVANASTFDEFKTAFKNLSKPAQDANVLLGLQLSTSLLRGNTQAALGLIDNRIEAAENTGTPQALEEAQRLLAIRGEIELDPVGFATSNLANMNSQGAIDSSALKTLLETSGQNKKTVAASPIGQIAQDVNAGLIPQSVLDAQIRVAEKAGDEGLTLQQRVSEEARLRGEYSLRTKDLSDAARNYSIIETSAKDDSGAGDIALVTSFMKMLDPGSVVRETEFAIARNSGGLLASLRTIADKVESGKFLTERQRADFKRLSGEYLKAAQVQEARVRSTYETIVDNYGLNRTNVFGASQTVPPDEPPDEPEPEDQTQAGSQASEPPQENIVPESFSKRQSVIDAGNAAGVTPEQMWSVMTPEMRAHYGQ